MQFKKKLQAKILLFLCLLLKHMTFIRTRDIGYENESEFAAHGNDVWYEWVALQDEGVVLSEVDDPGGVGLHVPHHQVAHLVAGDNKVGIGPRPAHRVHFESLKKKIASKK